MEELWDQMGGLPTISADLQALSRNLASIGSPSDGVLLRDNTKNLRCQLKRKICEEQIRQSRQLDQNKNKWDRNNSLHLSLAISGKDTYGRVLLFCCCDFKVSVITCVYRTWFMYLWWRMCVYTMYMCRSLVTEQQRSNAQQLHSYVTSLHQLMEEERTLIQRHPAPNSTAGHQRKNTRT